MDILLFSEEVIFNITINVALNYESNNTQENFDELVKCLHNNDEKNKMLFLSWLHCSNKIELFTKLLNINGLLLLNSKLICICCANENTIYLEKVLDHFSITSSYSLKLLIQPMLNNKDKDPTLINHMELMEKYI